MNFEAPLTSLVWITSILSMIATFIISKLMIPVVEGNETLWWKLSLIISCGTLAGAVIPELVKVFTSTESRHTKEVVISSREGGASLNILSGLVAGNFSAYYLGLTMVALMGLGYYFTQGLTPDLMLAPAVFAFGLVAFGFLGMGPVTIAVDSYGPVTDNAQSVYELSLIEHVPVAEIQREYKGPVNFQRAKDLLEENDGAGNTFKATAKPVLIGTAVVGATTMIFSIIMALTNGLRVNLANLSLLHAPFVLGLISGGAIIYWFTGASIQAVTTGAYRAVEFIKANIRLEGVEKASVSDSKKVVQICTQYAQKGMFNIFLAVFFVTLAFAFVEPFFFIGYLISIAVFGLYQAIFMANAGGAWDNGSTRCHCRRRHRGRSVQRHFFGCHEPDHQVHDVVWLAGSRVGGSSDGRTRSRAHQRLGGAVLRDFDVFCLAVVLRHAHREPEGIVAPVVMVETQHAAGLFKFAVPSQRSTAFFAARLRTARNETPG